MVEVDNEEYIYKVRSHSIPENTGMDSTNLCSYFSCSHMGDIMTEKRDIYIDMMVDLFDKTKEQAAKMVDEALRRREEKRKSEDHYAVV